MWVCSPQTGGQSRWTWLCELKKRRRIDSFWNEWENETSKMPVFSHSWAERWHNTFRWLFWSIEMSLLSFKNITGFVGLFHCNWCDTTNVSSAFATHIESNLPIVEHTNTPIYPRSIVLFAWLVHRKIPVRFGTARHGTARQPWFALVTFGSHRWLCHNNLHVLHLVCSLFSVFISEHVWSKRWAIKSD